MGHNIIEALESVHAKYNTLFNLPKYFLEDKIILDLIGGKRNIQSSIEEDASSLVYNPAEFVEKRWLKWILRKYPENQRLNPKNNEAYFEAEKYDALEKMIVPVWTDADEILIELDNIGTPYYQSDSIVPSQDSNIAGQLNCILENDMDSSEVIKTYGLVFPFYAMGVEQSAKEITKCMVRGEKPYERLKIMCKKTQAKLSKLNYAIFAHGVKHSSDIISRHEGYREISKA